MESTGQLSDWVKGRSFALGSISYVLRVWVFLGELLAMFILASLHILKVQRSRKARDIPSVTSYESQVWNVHMGGPLISGHEHRDAWGLFSKPHL